MVAAAAASSESMSKNILDGFCYSQRWCAVCGSSRPKTIFWAIRGRAADDHGQDGDNNNDDDVTAASAT